MRIMTEFWANLSTVEINERSKFLIDSVRLLVVAMH